MKLWIFSDLHIEFSKLEKPPAIPDADVCVVAGDILDRGIAPSIRWLGENVSRYMAVVFVAGNHEFYGSFMGEALAAGQAEAARYPDLHFLENREVVIDDVVFIGATLWTDFALFGTPALSAQRARAVMADYKAIGYQKQPFRRLIPSDTIRAFTESRNYIFERLQVHREHKCVVITHHAPSEISSPHNFIGDELSPAFSSDMRQHIEDNGPEVWVHGHIHELCLYRLGKTIVVCNPNGYPDERESDPFDWEFTISM